MTDSLLEKVIRLEVKLADNVDQIRQMETQTRLLGRDQLVVSKKYIKNILYFIYSFNDFATWVHFIQHGGSLSS